MSIEIDRREMVKRFLSYCRVDTQSSEESTSRPSTSGQMELLERLSGELEAIGATALRLDDRGYLYATIPENLPAGHPLAGKAPAIGLIAHVDTSPSVTGATVRPVIHEGYEGGPIVLAGDSSQVIRPEESPELERCIGHDIITADGTTLLGADDKAGVAEIMTLAATLRCHPSIHHGPIRIAFTTDEEIGKGAEHFDVEGFKAVAAYTADGGTAGEIEDETFCADTVRLTIHGINVHPGFAKDKMINAVKLAAEIIERFPKGSLSPETTERREGYVHPHKIEGEEEETRLKILVRDFEAAGLEEKEALIRRIAGEVERSHPGCRIEMRIEPSYRNMKERLDEHPEVVARAVEAIRRAGLEPKRSIIRGGTDGAVLTAKGLPTPNIFTGGHNFHSKREWISIQDMESAVLALVELAALWVE